MNMRNCRVVLGLLFRVCCEGFIVVLFRVGILSFRILGSWHRLFVRFGF